jgi:2,4-dienoyl-CoA reductase-like NADH-dependent reductase (Old Yellow Enzyme family)
MPQINHSSTQVFLKPEGPVYGPSDVVDPRTGIKIEAISMCRPLIREPGLVKRWSQGDTKEATCLACNGCFNPEGTTCFQDLTGEAKKRQQTNLKKR